MFFQKVNWHLPQPACGIHQLLARITATSHQTANSCPGWLRTGINILEGGAPSGLSPETTQETEPQQAAEQQSNTSW